MGRKRLNYDDEALVEMISDGQMTYKAIGQKLGISEILVKQIAQGRRRKELGQRLWDAENGILAEARRIATQYARNMVMEQIRLGLRGEGEPARRAREFILKFAVSSRPRRDDVPGQRDRRPEEMLQMARDIGVVPWEDELDAEREREAVEEEARKRESCSAKATQDSSCSDKATQDGPCVATSEAGQATGTGGSEREAGGVSVNLGQVTAAASMPATGVFPGPAAAAGPEEAERTDKASIREARLRRVEHPLSIP